LREEFVLSTKVGRYFEPGSEDRLVYDYSRDGARRALDQSLTRLGLDRADIVLIHDIDRWTHGECQPARFGEALDGGYRALSDLKGEGVVRAIGIGVNEWQVCDAFVRRAPIDCVLLAGRHTLLEQDAAEYFLPICVEKGVGVIVGGPYNSGILATGVVTGATYNYGSAPPLLADRVRRLEAKCNGYGVPLPVAALAFPLLHPAVATVIPGMVSASEVAGTVAWAATNVPAGLWDELCAAGLIRDHST
jgi:D-threo-aldose 1-dehydrogenase